MRFCAIDQICRRCIGLCNTGQWSGCIFVVKGEEKGADLGYIMYDAAPNAMPCLVVSSLRTDL
jgi:hypothetical protein